MTSLSASFFDRDTVAVARALLGCTLTRTEEDGSVSGGRIVETEAYLGANDPAAHSRNGLRSKRNASMYLPAGHIYVYFTYGMHHCLNVVTAGENEPEAVLIRALEPTHGLERIRNRREKARTDAQLTNGPAKICQALDIDLSLDGSDLSGGPIRIVCTEEIDDAEIGVSGRIGIDRSGVADWPLRFFVKDSPFLSR